MKDILSEIITNKRREIIDHKCSVSIEQLKAEAAEMPATRSMRAALEASTNGIIAEFKRRSPSKGWINEWASAEVVPAAYAAAGAAALSILTDEEYFAGGLEDIQVARPMVNIPILRKGFIVEEYQVYQSRVCGADAILLIAAALEVEECHRLIETAHEVELEVLLEIHSEKELEYLHPDVDMVGVNNRNLGTFDTDVQNSFRIAELLPKDAVKVSESGISDPKIVSELRAAGYRGFLIGENFMRNEEPAEALKDFISKL